MFLKSTDETSFLPISFFNVRRMANVRRETESFLRKECQLSAWDTAPYFSLCCNHLDFFFCILFARFLARHGGRVSIPSIRVLSVLTPDNCPSFNKNLFEYVEDRDFWSMSCQHIRCGHHLNLSGQQRRRTPPQSSPIHLPTTRLLTTGVLLSASSGHDIAHIMPFSHKRKEPRPCPRNSAVAPGTPSPTPA
jgi:hypothetical protein